MYGLESHDENLMGYPLGKTWSPDLSAYVLFLLKNLIQKIYRSAKYYICSMFCTKGQRELN